MSVLTDLIYGGANAVAALAEGAVNDAVSKSLTYLTKRHKEISADSLRVQANLTITKTIKKLVQLTSAAQEETVQVDYIEDYQKKQQAIGLPEGE